MNMCPTCCCFRYPALFFKNLNHIVTPFLFFVEYLNVEIIEQRKIKNIYINKMPWQRRHFNKRAAWNCFLFRDHGLFLFILKTTKVF